MYESILDTFVIFPMILLSLTSHKSGSQGLSEIGAIFVESSSSTSSSFKSVFISNEYMMGLVPTGGPVIYGWETSAISIV